MLRTLEHIRASALMTISAFVRLDPLQTTETRRGIVSSRVALLLRSAEIQPMSHDHLRVWRSFFKFPPAGMLRVGRQAPERPHAQVPSARHAPSFPTQTTCSSAAERLAPSQEARVRFTARAQGVTVWSSMVTRPSLGFHLVLLGFHLVLLGFNIV